MNVFWIRRRCFRPSICLRLKSFSTLYDLFSIVELCGSRNLAKYRQGFSKQCIALGLKKDGGWPARRPRERSLLRRRNEDDLQRQLGQNNPLLDWDAGLPDAVFQGANLPNFVKRHLSNIIHFHASKINRAVAKMSFLPYPWEYLSVFSKLVRLSF